MKQDYTIAELQAEIAALQQLFDCVTLADPCRGCLLYTSDAADELEV